MLDVDGCTLNKRKDTALCTWISDGKRARECAFCFIHYVEYKEPIYEIMYFYDPPEFTSIYDCASMKDSSVCWNISHLTGLRAHPRPTRTRCHASTEAFMLIRNRIQYYKSLCAPEPLMILAKGGHELSWVQTMNLTSLFYLNLERVSCPRVESLAMIYNDTKNCGEHFQVRQRFAAFRRFTREAVHCLSIVGSQIIHDMVAQRRPGCVRNPVVFFIHNVIRKRQTNTCRHQGYRCSVCVCGSVKKKSI